jgi:hypothetical protein
LDLIATQESGFRGVGEQKMTRDLWRKSALFRLHGFYYGEKREITGKLAEEFLGAAGQRVSESASQQISGLAT